MWVIALSCANAKPASAMEAQICLKIDRTSEVEQQRDNKTLDFRFLFYLKEILVLSG